MERAFYFRTQNFPRLYVSGFFLGTQDSWEYWQQNMLRKARKIYILPCLERTWERGSCLKNSTYGNSNNDNEYDDDSNNN